MQVGALLHGHQPGVGIHPLQPAGGQLALHDADLFGAHLGPAEEPVLAPHGDDPQGPPRVVGVDGHGGSPQVDLQRGLVVGDTLAIAPAFPPPLAIIGQGSGQGIAVHQADALTLLEAPQ